MRIYSIISLVIFLFIPRAEAQFVSPYLDRGHLELSGTCDDIGERGLRYDYDICLGKKKIGEYRTIQYRNGDLTYYCGESHVEIWLFGKISIDYYLECAFTDSGLLYSTCVGYRNGKERLRSEIMMDDGRWLVRQDGGPWEEHPPIHSSLIKLYYTKPNVGDMTIVEGTLVSKCVIERNDETYYLQEPGKKGVSEFIYREGEIERVNVHFAMLDFSVVRNSRTNADRSLGEEKL